MLGHKQTEKTRRKISESLKGKPTWNKGKKQSEETIRKRVEGRKGYKHSEETKKKIGEAHRGKKLRYPVWSKGKKFSFEYRQKLSKSHIGKVSGKNNPNWKGGFRPFVKLIRESPKYQQWRSDVFERDKWTCQTCQKKGGNLHAHHIKGFRVLLKEYGIKTIEEALACKPLWDIDNGVTLCVECHILTRKPQIKQ